MALTDIGNVQLELSNRCGYSAIHPRCPNDAKAPPVNLPLALAERVVEELAGVDFAGDILFSSYNEPLTDPRLFYLLDRLRAVCPKAKPYMYTNGWNLDQCLLNELARFGLKRIYISQYGDGERARLAGLSFPSGVRGYRDARPLDARMKLYDQPPHGELRPCPALSRQVIVWHTGEVGLCCMDWKHAVTFGSLHKSSLADILVTPKRREMSDRLSRGDRSCARVCSACKRR